MLSNNTVSAIANVSEYLNGTSKVHAASTLRHLPQIVSIFTPIYWTLAGAIVAVNGALLLLYFRDKAVRLSLNHFIVSLIVTDIMFGGVGIPLLQQYPHRRLARGSDVSDGVCIVTLILQFGIVNMVPWGVAFIAVDRLVAVARPSSYKVVITNRRSKIAVVSLWCFVFFFHMLPLMRLDLVGGEEWRNYCSGYYRYPVAYRHTMVQLLLVIPIILTTTCYIAMYIVIKRRNNQSAIFGTGESQPSFQKAVRAAKTCLITTLLVCTGWVPFLGSMTVIPLLSNVTSPTRVYIFSVTFLFAAAVSAANPVVYFVRSHVIKTALRHTFRHRVVPVNHTANGRANGTSSGQTKGTSTGRANGTSTGGANGTSTGRANGTSNGQTKGTSTGRANGTSTGRVNGTSTGRVNGTSTGQVNGTSTGRVNDTSHA